MLTLITFVFVGFGRSSDLFDLVGDSALVALVLVPLVLVPLVLVLLLLVLFVLVGLTSDGLLLLDEA